MTQIINLRLPKHVLRQFSIEVMGLDQGAANGHSKTYYKPECHQKIPKQIIVERVETGHSWYVEMSKEHWLNRMASLGIHSDHHVL